MRKERKRRKRGKERKETGEAGTPRGEANKEAKIERGEGMLDLGVSFARTMAPSQSETR
jgi:hypothetical protein